MMRGSAIAISVGDRLVLVRDVEHRDAVPAYAARTAVAPVGIDDVVRIPEGLNEGTLAALLGRRHRGIRKSGGSRQQQTKSEAEKNQELTRLNSAEYNPLQSRGVSVAACCDYLPAKSI